MENEGIAGLEACGRRRVRGQASRFPPVIFGEARAQIFGADLGVPLSAREAPAKSLDERRMPTGQQILRKNVGTVATGARVPQLSSPTR